MKEIWVLQLWEYSSYSYNGISENERFYHATEQGARDHAKELGYKIVEYCKEANTEATLSKEGILQ